MVLSGIVIMLVFPLNQNKLQLNLFIWLQHSLSSWKPWQTIDTYFTNDLFLYQIHVQMFALKTVQSVYADKQG